MTLEPRLIAISDIAGGSLPLSSMLSLCEEAKAGSVLLILRDRQLEQQERALAAEQLACRARATGMGIAVADPWDDDAGLNYDGLHLSSQGELPSALRRRCSWLSRAFHGFSELPASELALLDGILISPIWAPRKGRSALGAQGLRRLIEEVQQMAPGLKCFALGGVGADNAAASLQAGASGVAVMSGLRNDQERMEILKALEIAL